jgi:hypothetical protein
MNAFILKHAQAHADGLQDGPRNFKDVAVPSICGLEVPAVTSCFQDMGQLGRCMVCHSELLPAQN